MNASFSDVDLDLAFVGEQETVKILFTKGRVSVADGFTRRLENLKEDIKGNDTVYP